MLANPATPSPFYYKPAPRLGSSYKPLPEPSYKPTPYKYNPTYKPKPKQKPDYNPLRKPSYKPEPTPSPYYYKPVPKPTPNPYAERIYRANPAKEPTATPSPVPKPVTEPERTYKTTTTPAPPYKPVPTTTEKPKLVYKSKWITKPEPKVHKPEPKVHKPEPKIYKPEPKYEPKSKPEYKPTLSYDKEPAYPDHIPKYDNSYAVVDEYAGLNFGAHETRDGDITNGGYSVLLPDGRTQHVTYNVGEGYAGYIADIKYTGEAKAYHPEPTAYNPTYKPAPKATSGDKTETKPSPGYKPEPTPEYKPVPPPLYQPQPVSTTPAPEYESELTTTTEKPKLVYKSKWITKPEPKYKPDPAAAYKPKPEPKYKPTPSPVYYKPYHP